MGLGTLTPDRSPYLGAPKAVTVPLARTTQYPPAACAPAGLAAPATSPPATATLESSPLASNATPASLSACLTLASGQPASAQPTAYLQGLRGRPRRAHCAPRG